MQFLPNRKTVELCLTYRCNLQCYNCSNLCAQAPFKGDLSPSGVEIFLENITGKGITLITLHGGEPCLNPFIEDILKLLCNFRERTGTQLWLLTNNSNEIIRRKVTKLHCDFNVKLGIATKTGNTNSYIPVNESPTDLNEPFTLGCFQTSDCGICFNWQGFFPCSPLAAAARLFGYDSCKTFDQLTDKRCKEYFELHCRHCGFAMPNRRRVTEQTTTETWQKAFDYFTERKIV